MAHITDAEAFTHAVGLQRRGQHRDAATIYKRLLAAGRRDWQLLHNLGWACYRTFDPQAEIYLREAATLAPRPAVAQRALGYALKSAGKFAEAEAVLREAVRSLPADDTAHEALAHAVLGQGRWSEGFQLLDGRVHRRTSEGWRLPTPEWRGQSLTGKRLLILSEQGFGDQIQMARYLPALDAAQITYVGPPALARLFAAFPVNYVSVGPGQPVSVDCHDYWTLPFSLPLHLGIGAISGAPYLPSNSSGSGIGLAWKGNPENWVDAARSLPKSLAEELLSIPGVISLQPEDTGAADFADTARIVNGLAHVIAVDSAVAHLAGAMAKPLSILLPFMGRDWRWLSGRIDSPWYSSANLFSQTEHDWHSVANQVREMLAL